MTQQIHTFLMFEGRAKEAMELYIDVLGGEIINLIPSEDGKVHHATFTLKGQEFMAIDSAIHHEFTFTPAISMMVACESEEEIDRVYARLSEGGLVLMPLGELPEFKKFCWIQDKFGVSWQLTWS